MLGLSIDSTSYNPTYFFKLALQVPKIFQNLLEVLGVFSNFD